MAKNETNYANEIAELSRKLEELRKAQAEEEEAKKKALSATRKIEATRVEDAFKAYNAAKEDYNKTVSEAKKLYLQAVADAKKLFQDNIAESETKLNKAEDDYEGALADFTKAHPEGYHLTLKDKDCTKVISRSGNSDVFGMFDNLFDYFFNYKI